MSQAIADYSFRRSPHFWADLTGRKPDADSTVPLIAMEYFATGSFTGCAAILQGHRREGRGGARGRGERGRGDRRRAARPRIIPPPDHHDADVEALKRQAAAARGR